MNKFIFKKHWKNDKCNKNELNWKYLFSKLVCVLCCALWASHLYAYKLSWIVPFSTLESSSIGTASIIGRKKTPQKLQKIAVKSESNSLCGITATRVIGPFFLRDSMNGEKYHHMLAGFIIPEMKQMNKIHIMIFMQDGALTHCKNIIVRDLLNNTFPGRLIGSRGSYNWTARSPDLTPCDFFLWGWEIPSLQTWTTNYRRAWRCRA